MEIQVQITVTQAGQTTTATVANFQRDTLTAETLGLTLAEAQQLLVNLQQIIATEQVATYNQQQYAQGDPYCGSIHRCPGVATIGVD